MATIGTFVQTGPPGILFLSASGAMGGAERSLSTLLDSLRVRRPEARLLLLLSGDGLLAEAARAACIPIEVLPFPPDLADLGGRGRLSFRTWLNLPLTLRACLKYRRQLQALLASARVDIVQTNGWKMHLLVASLADRGTAGAPRPIRVCHLHESTRARPLRRALLKLLRSRFDMFVAPSRYVQDDLLDVPVDPRKVICIPNGLYLDRFTPEGRPAELDLPASREPAPQGVRVGLVATFAKWKGHTTFFRALALLPPHLPVRAYVVGGPIYETSGSQHTREQLHVAARQLCPERHVTFTDFVEDVASVYRALDVVVHASTEPEPFGMVALEALACRRALIVSFAGGMRELVVPEVTALAHDPGDAVALARQIERLACDPVLRGSLADNGYRSVRERFGAEAMGDAFLALYDRLLGDRRDSSQSEREAA